MIREIHASRFAALLLSTAIAAGCNGGGTDDGGGDVISTDAARQDAARDVATGTDAARDVPTTSDVAARDVGPTSDVTTADGGTDVISVTDAGNDDVVTVTDTGTGTDVISTTDAGTDVITVTDTGTGIDVVTPTDTGTGTDVVTPTDTGTATDTGTVTDTGAATDSGTAVDGGFCPGSLNLSTVGTLTGNDTAYTGDNTAAPTTAVYVPTCTTEAGAQVIFTYTTRQTAALQIGTVDPNTTFDTVVEALAGCDPTSTAIGCNDDFGSSAPQSQFTTTTLPPGTTVVIAVGGYNATTPATGTFVLHVLEIPVVGVGGTCDPTGATTSCVTGTVCLTVAGASTCTVPPVIPVGGTCDPAGVNNTCVAGTTCVTVAGTSTCTVPAATETSITAACDNLSTGATTLTDAIGDDNATAILPLPTGFTFSFFGTSVGYYSATSNGFMQLWTDTTGTPSTAYGNAAIPTTSLTNFVAPFWDDLYFAVGGTGTVRSATFGTAPNRRFVVEWNGAELYSLRTAVLTFQAKLFETTNVIELHYCTLTPTTNANVTGGSATVGIENAAGTSGVQHSYNTTGSVNTTSAIRYTP